jgi:anaerobic magnesium-protoporphyrin IX monomethyl ester cyclase
MKVLAVYPALLSGWASYREHGNNESSYMNHGFAMISAVLKRDGDEVEMLDLRTLRGWDEFIARVFAARYDFAIMSWLSCDDEHAKMAAAILKRVHPDRLVVAGGIHLSVTEATEYPNVDVIVHGEGEEWILGIVRTLEAGEKPRPVYPLKPVAELDGLPFVDRYLFNPAVEETSPLLPLLPEPFQTIVAGRGCWGKCTFCAPSRERISGRKCRIRSPGNVIEEIVGLRTTRGVGSLMIHDDLLGTNRWMEEFIGQWHVSLPRIPFWCQLRADTVLRLREYMPALARIGLTWVSLGLESGSQRMLDWLKKGTLVQENLDAAELLHENQVNIFGNYIVGLPTETEEDLDATEAMLAEIRPEWHSGSTYTSYPGSHLYEWVKENDYWAGGTYSDHLPHSLRIKGVNYEMLERLTAGWRTEYQHPLRVWHE